MKIRLARLKPVYWSLLIFVIAQILTFTVILRQDDFLTEHNIYVPKQPSQTVTIWPGTITETTPVIETTTLPTGEITTTTTTVTQVTEISGYSSLLPILIYFFAVVIVLGIVLFFVPLRVLRTILKALFVILFTWGMFIFLVFWIPLYVTIAVAVIAAIAWFFIPKVWLHNIVMVLALVSVGAVFGRLIAPWTAMIVLAVLAIYDFLAVRFGYMIWMAKKMSESSTLPAIVLPHGLYEWNHTLKATDFVVEEKPADRKYSILGGGDIGFSLLITASVFFAFGYIPAIIMAFFTLSGLTAAYWIQSVFLKGKPMPALPPIAVMSLIGLLIINFTF